VPAPVSVTVFPLIVAGPLFTLNVTGKLELEAGTETTNGAAPKTLSPIVLKAAIVWLDLEMVIVATCRPL
jgi:hypothetical protein